jgi:hypothetical protein
MSAHGPAHVSAQAAVPALALIPARPLPASGNTALAASAVVQASLGIEFALAGLNKLADPAYVANFSSFVRSSPGSNGGPLALLVQVVVLPNAELIATLLKITELILGPVLVIGAFEIGRRRLAGRLGAAHGYEAGVALVAALAGLTAAGLSFSIFLLTDGMLPTVMPGRAFTSAIPVELLIVPLGLSVAWLEFGRFAVLRHRSRPAVVRANR